MDILIIVLLLVITFLVCWLIWNEEKIIAFENDLFKSFYLFFVSVKDTIKIEKGKK
jgi:hypothetical protein